MTSIQIVLFELIPFYPSSSRDTGVQVIVRLDDDSGVHMRQKTNLSSALLYYSFMTLFFQMSSLIPSFPHSIIRVKIFHAKKEVILFSK